MIERTSAASFFSWQQMKGKKMEKKIEVILEELQRPFDIADLKNHAQDINMANKEWPYAPASCYKKRLDDVLTVQNWRAEYSPANVQLLENKGIVTIFCKLQIFAEDGTLLLEKTGNGGHVITFSKDGTAFNSYSNDLLGAEAMAFKNCCKQLKIGGDIIEIWKASSSKSSRRKNETDSSSVVLIPNGKKTFFSKTKPEAFSIPVIEKETGEVASLIVWENVKEMLMGKKSVLRKKSRWEDFVLWTESSKPMTLTVSKGIYRGEKQLTLQDA